jgi:hypothetical protein
MNRAIYLNNLFGLRAVKISYVKGPFTEAANSK